MHSRWIEALILICTVGAALANAWLNANPLFGAVALAFCVLYHAVTLGSRLIKRNQGIAATFVGLTVILAGQSIIQTLFYYLGWSLNSVTDATSLGLTLTLLIAILPEETTHEPAEVEEVTSNKKEIIWILTLLIPSLIAFGYAIKASSGVATDLAIRTPWPLLPIGTLVACILPAIAAWLAAWKTKSRVLVTSLAALSLISVTLIAPLVYSVGFGFDGFLHQASETILLNTGTLSPKPPYYIGQYVFVTWFTRLTQFNLETIDRFLVPLAAAALLFFLIPLSKKYRAFPVAVLLFLPIATLVVTTPQAFAYLIGLVAVITALVSRENKWHPAVPISFAVWALCIHPLAGLPLALGCAAILFPRLKYLFAIGAIASIPTAFAFLNTSQASITWNIANLWDAQTIQAFFSAMVPPQNRVALWADWASMVAFLSPWMMLIAAGVAIKHDLERRRDWILLSILGIGMIIAGIFLKGAGEFAFLIEYERGNYADRLFVISTLFLLAPAATGVSLILERMKRASAITAITLLLGLFSWHAAQAYNALPRFDASVASHGWSSSASDLEAVRWIDRDAGIEPYVVLANQSVSAIAVRELGFKRYAKDVFFYPIPTGGPLYQVFLRMVGTEINADTLHDASELGQSKLIYVVLNDYWWDASRVSESLAGLSQAQQSFGNGADRVYKFTLP
ncbi:MAG: hypothetical protein WCK01_01810 [Candidatus Uhrbacteria bacterium]